MLPVGTVLHTVVMCLILCLCVVPTCLTLLMVNISKTIPGQAHSTVIFISVHLSVEVVQLSFRYNMKSSYTLLLNLVLFLIFLHTLHTGKSTVSVKSSLTYGPSCF